MLREECGIFGIFGHPRAAEITYLGLHALQHRGEESSGIAAGDGKSLRLHTGLGQVTEVFRDHSLLEPLAGHLAIGHNRYSTTGGDSLCNAQPFLAECRDCYVALAHNGNLVNTVPLRRRMQQSGALFQTTTDSEVLVHLIARSQEEQVEDRIIDALSQAKGAYALVIATQDSLMAARDPLGFRPLCLGQLGDSWVVASESCALDMVSARYLRDVEPGEVVVIDRGGLRSLKPWPKTQHAFCVFEFIYFSRPDSIIFGDNVDKTRRRLGKLLAAEHPARADIVISVPDSSNTAALGYAEASGIRFEIGLIRNHYVGRTFIKPSQQVRDFEARTKYNPVRGVLKGKRVVVVEDSIVRGTTFKHIARMLREAGAAEIHVRVSAPPIISPCYYGIDFQTRDELIASQKTVEQIKEHLEVDSLGYLSMGGMLQAMPDDGAEYCTACFNAQYPVQIEETLGKAVLEHS
ncbi:MAG: amidophosphoribosyltransferase [Candidatus Latescibacteria bacterium]|nr:amidophosphoribosyltransferase [Candidatus Latescibacterota bacterium]